MSLQRSMSQRMRGRSPGRSPQPSKKQQKPLKTGWLKKQGGNFKTWNNRWFVIRGDQMYYYQKDDEIKVLGAIPLPGNKVIVHPHNIDEPGKFLFEIVAGRGQGRVTAAHETYPICATTKDERDLWVSAIHRVIYAPSGGAVFGQHLSDTMMYERKRKTGRIVPKVVEQSVNYLTEHGIDIEGIFRLPGLNKTIKKLKWDYDTAIDVDLTKHDVDVNSMASLLKLYFRELPEPVIPFQYYEMFLTMGLKIEHGDTRAMGTIHTLLDQLPTDNYNLLEYLCKFLSEVGRHSDKNKMPPMNLALVFGPNILKADIDDPNLLMSTTDLTTKTVFIFIAKHEEVFIRKFNEKTGSLHGSTENLLKKDYNSMTLTHPAISRSRDNSPVTKRLSKSPLCGSLPRHDPPVEDLLNLDYPTIVPRPDLLSPETGETKSLSDLSDSSCDSTSIAAKISMFGAAVAYRSGSESRRSRRSNQIGKCQDYTGSPGEPLSSESSPEILPNMDSSEVFGCSVGTGNGLPKREKPIPQKRSKPKEAKVSEQKGMTGEVDATNGDPASPDEHRPKPIPPKRPSRSKKHSRNTSDVSDTTSLDSVPNLIETDAKGAISVLSSADDVDRNNVVGTCKTSVCTCDTATESLMNTVMRLEMALKEQALKHHLQMSEVKQQYENKLKAMEDIFKVKINELAQQLVNEKDARAQTVDKIVGLQAELQKYQMTYGDLEDVGEWKPL